MQSQETVLSSDQVQSLRMRSSGEIKSSWVYIACVVLRNNFGSTIQGWLARWGCFSTTLPTYHLNQWNDSRLKYANLYASFKVRFINQLQLKARCPDLSGIPEMPYKCLYNTLYVYINT